MSLGQALNVLNRVACAALACAALAFLPASAEPFSAARASDDLDELLRPWITQNLRYERGRDGEDRLMIRRAPVRASIQAEDPAVRALARATIANFAGAFGIEHTWTTTNVNLVVVVTDHITIDGKPNKDLLRRLRVPEQIVDIIGTSGSTWAKGCGLYDGRDDAGRLALGLVFADTAGETEFVRKCIVTGIIFGFGLRLQGQFALDRPHDYVQFLLLARAIAQCESALAESGRDARAPARDGELACIQHKIKAKLTE